MSRILDELCRYHCLAVFVQALQQDTLQHIHSILIVPVPALSLKKKKNGTIGVHHGVLLELQNEVPVAFSHATLTAKQMGLSQCCLLIQLF